MEEGLLKKTGKPLDHWIGVVKASGFEKHGEIVKHLKSEYGFTHGFANFVALKSREADAGSASPDTLVEAQYEKKPGLRPIYDRLLAEISKLGDDIDIVPKKANVSFRVKRQFALVQPSTKTRMDIGLKFNDRPTGGRLEASGPFGTMCSHRVQVTSVDDIDAELLELISGALDEAR